MMGKAAWRTGAAGMALFLAACSPRVDPMSIVQSADEYNCREALEDQTGSRDLTLLALSRGEDGATSRFLANRQGVTWTCRTNLAGFVVQTFPDSGAG